MLSDLFCVISPEYCLAGGTSCQSKYIAKLVQIRCFIKLIVKVNIVKVMLWLAGTTAA